jgi:uncharacterized protein
LVASDSLLPFLQKDYVLADFSDDPKILQYYGQLDDNDIWGAIKFWINNHDPILSLLATMIIERKLFQIRLSAEPIKKNQVEDIQVAITKKYGLLRAEAKYLFSHGTVTNEAYAEGQEINVLMKGGDVLDLAQASDLPNIKAISKIVKKNYLCWPKTVSL